MEITDVRIKLVNNTSDRLKAFCSITLDDEFVIRDIKLVEGSSGLFVAMPSRKLAHSCPDCHHKNPLRAHFCNECGADLPALELPVDDQGRLRLYRDIAHPITPEFREKLQGLIVEAYEGEQVRAADPDYEPSEGVDLDDELNDSVGNRREETSEYDELIAGLDPGSGTRTSRPRERRDDRPRGAGSRGSRGDQRGGGRADRRPATEEARGGQRRRGRGGRRRKPEEERRTQVSEPRTAPAAELVPEKTGALEKPLFDRSDSRREEQAPMIGGQVDHRSPGHREDRDRDPDHDRVSLDKTAKEIPDAEILEDSTPFGAGIL